ncbi:hypothetical protein D3C71_1807400 [compost metagenome]
MVETSKEVTSDYLLALDGYRLAKATGLTYFDFVHADVCFIEATANTTEKGWVGLADLLGERAKNGLPTYVMGYWPTKGGMSSQTKGLRYLLASSLATIRLNLLVPYELSSEGSDNGKEQLGVEIGTSKSNIPSGITINKLLS